MCGIVGIIGNINSEDNIILKSMNRALSHRGPNANGEFSGENFSLGHSRLSIIDLSELGNQPMEYNNRYVIAFNGEIYNYLELKAELKEKGYKFKTNTDTEIIPAAYDFWGINCLNKFNGMWAFTLIDNKTKKFFISRDRFGIKPLYFYSKNNQLIFASEIKAFKKNPKINIKPNNKYLLNFLKTGPKAQFSETAFENIYSFPSASYYLGDLNKPNKFNPNKFWELIYNNKKSKFSENKAIEYSKKYYEILYDAVKIRLRSDVPVGSALSGGLDSSSIVYIINDILRSNATNTRQETFSVVYPKSKSKKDCDESFYIDEMVNHLSLNSNRIEPNVLDIPKEMIHIQWHYENPMESSNMSAWHTFKLIGSSDIRVTLDGQGADELLAGYLCYVINYLSNLSFIDFFTEALYFLKIPGIHIYVLISLTYQILSNLFGRKASQFLFSKLNLNIHIQPLNQRLAEGITGPYQNLLHYLDSTSMAFSIESRLPFMDYRLVEFLASIPEVYKIHNGWTKYIARLAFRDKLPKSICWRKDKKGWETPDKEWFEGLLNNWMISKIKSSKILRALIINKKNLNKFRLRQRIRFLSISIMEELFL